MPSELEIKNETATDTDHISGDVHLQRLLTQEASTPWFLTFFGDLKEYFFPPKLPPLEVTSKPVQIKDVWGFYGQNRGKAGLSSALIHGLVVVLMFTLGTNEDVQQAAKDAITLVAPINLDPYMPQAKPQQQQMGGGGGGGDRSPLPASKGRAPRASLRQFVPPAAVVHNEDPKLVMEPTIVLPSDVQLPNVNMAQWGDPLAKIGPPSNGPGSGGGIGSGSGGGIGSGQGPGFGPGRGGGIGGGVFRIGGGVSAPTLVYKVEPEYSEEARKAKFQGTVVLSVVVDEKGNPRDLRVIRALGLGLDEKAIEAVQKWRFKPGFLQGKPVAVAATVEVNFRLL
ncbi:MAG: energy transducer TonB [Acidimicrobiia bacterium]|nr:energy transducer TonB [Acidimicrobiia bacterium]